MLPWSLTHSWINPPISVNPAYPCSEISSGVREAVSDSPLRSRDGMAPVDTPSSRPAGDSFGLTSPEGLHSLTPVDGCGKAWSLWGGNVDSPDPGDSIELPSTGVTSHDERMVSRERLRFDSSFLITSPSPGVPLPDGVR